MAKADLARKYVVSYVSADPVAFLTAVARKDTTSALVMHMHTRVAAAESQKAARDAALVDICKRWGVNEGLKRSDPAYLSNPSMVSKYGSPATADDKAKDPGDEARDRGIRHAAASLAVCTLRQWLTSHDGTFVDFTLPAPPPVA